eukprot:Em0001g206a
MHMSLQVWPPPRLSTTQSSRNRAVNPFSATSLPSSLSNSSSADAARAGTSAAPSGLSHLSSSVAGASAAPSAGPSHVNSYVAGPSHSPPDCNAAMNSAEIAARFSSMEAKLGRVLAELEDIKKSLAKKNFLQKGSPKELALRTAVANLFCETVSRFPAEESINAVIADILGNDIVSQPKKYETALRYCKSKFTDLRSEERRKVLGNPPHTKCAILATKELAKRIVKSIHADRTLTEIYEKHLAMFRKFVRCCHDASKVKHSEFTKWMEEYYPTLNDEQWRGIMDEDRGIIYERCEEVSEEEVAE